MHLYLVTPPASEPLTLAEVKDHLRVDHDDEDALIGRLIASVRQDLDGRDGKLGRALIRQTWDLKLACFPACIEVPLPPLATVTSVKYLDADGAEQTLSPSLYRVAGVNGWGPARIRPVVGEIWPTTYHDLEAVTVRFVCGYPPDNEQTPSDHAANVPMPIKEAMLMMIEDLYGVRGSVIIGVSVNTTDEIDNRLANYRVIPFA